MMYTCLFDYLFVFKPPMGIFYHILVILFIALLNVFLFYFDRQISTYQRYNLSYLFASYEVSNQFLDLCSSDWYSWH